MNFLTREIHHVAVDHQFADLLAFNFLLEMRLLTGLISRRFHHFLVQVGELLLLLLERLRGVTCENVAGAESLQVLEMHIVRVAELLVQLAHFQRFLPVHELQDDRDHVDTESLLIDDTIELFDAFLALLCVVDFLEVIGPSLRKASLWRCLLPLLVSALQNSRTHKPEEGQVVALAAQLGHFEQDVELVTLPQLHDCLQIVQDLVYFGAGVVWFFVSPGRCGQLELAFRQLVGVTEEFRQVGRRVLHFVEDVVDVVLKGLLDHSGHTLHTLRHDLVHVSIVSDFFVERKSALNARAVAELERRLLDELRDVQRVSFHGLVEQHHILVHCQQSRCVAVFADQSHVE